MPSSTDKGATMPGTVKAACVLIVLSVLQAIFNLRYIHWETTKQAVPEIVFLCILVAIIAGIICRRRWVCRIYVGLTMIGLLLFVLGFFAGIHVWRAGTIWEYMLALLALTPVRALLQLVSILLLFTNSARTWFSPPEQRQAAQ
jgi:cation transporter-like permease